MADKITSLQVAERAGVSQSAVSRVFTPGASVSQKTREKVEKAASELGYRPNVLARAMVSGKSRIIGLVVAYLENQFYPTAIEKLSNVLQEHGYHVLIFTAAQVSGNIDEILEEILDYQVDGIIMASVSLSSQIASRYRKAGVPIVFFNRSQDVEGISSVTSDNYTGGRKIAQFLLAGGHKRIGYIGGWEGASTQRDREAGFRAALDEAGVEIYARETGDFKTDTARAAARRMFDKPEHLRPDAVFAANDHMAIAAIDVIQFELGLRVPEDVSIVGYDDVPPASWLAYNLTTMRQRTNLMVEEAVAVLLEHINNPNGARARKVAIDGPLIVRGSARLPKNYVSKGRKDEGL